MAKVAQQSELDRMIGTSGAIKELVRFPRSPLDLPLHVVTARIEPSLEAELSESVARCVASGVSDDPQIANAAAVGEAWERIAFVHQNRSLCRSSKLVTASVLAADDLFELPYLLDKGTNRSAWAAQSVEAPWRPGHYWEQFIDAAPRAQVVPAWVGTQGAPGSLFETTNGLACASSFEVAMDRAAREVVERDALMLVWLSRCGGTRLDPANYLTPKECEQLARLSNMGIQSRFRDISTEFGVTVVLAVLFASFPGKRLGVAFGAGAHRVPQFAARHAFREAGLSWRGVSWRSLAGEEPEEEAETPRSFAEHAEYYSSWKRMHLLDFLLADDAYGNGPPPDLRIDTPDEGHVSLLLQHGRRVLATDITPEQAVGTGLSVVQVLVPGLVPLYIADRCADDLAKLRFPTRIGGRFQTLPEDLNTLVHPWP